MPEKFSQMFPVLGAIAAFLLAAFLLLLIFRLLFGRKVRAPGPRNRPRRLDVVDVFDVDRERQLVIVRRDNIEHLLLIGGPNDVLVESAIHRVEGQLGRPAEGRAAPPPAGGWPAGPAAPHPRDVETAAKPAAATLPTDLFAPAPKPPAPPAPHPAPPPASTAARAPAPPSLPPRPAPPRAPTPPFLARAQRVVQDAAKEPPPPAAAPPPAAPPAAPAKPVAPGPAPANVPAPGREPPKPPTPPAAAPPARPPAPEAAPVKPKAPPAPQAAAAPRPTPKAPPPEPPPAPQKQTSAEIDPLESLEAEMARLLGRPDKE